MTLGQLELPNRLALAPTYVGMGDERGGVTGRYAYGPGFGRGAASDGHTPGLRDLARVIHWGGARAILQLLAGQGAQAMRDHKQRPLVGPSDVPALIQGEGLPRLLEGFGQGGLRSRALSAWMRSLN